MSNGPPEFLRRIDERILSELADSEPEYLPIVANRLGVHLRYAEDRCERLEAEDLIERVSGEELYRVTERGRRYVEGASVSQASATTD